jgi:quercetin dioxygenase-like cupin family protein
VLSGQMAVTLGSEVTQLGAGDLMALAPGEPHSVYAISRSEMLLTVCHVAHEPGPVAAS